MLQVCETWKIQNTSHVSNDVVINICNLQIDVLDHLFANFAYHYLGSFFTICRSESLLRKQPFCFVVVVHLVNCYPDQFCLQNYEQRLPYELTFKKDIICKVRYGIWWLFVETVGEDKHKKKGCILQEHC